jgi:hypothetical protein
MSEGGSILTADQIVARAADAAFGRPLIVNNLRGLVVEVIVDSVLSSEWIWCAGDWAGWDFEHADGTRVQVKQSAAKQSWTARPKQASSPRFDISSSTGHWEEGAKWVASPGRLAHIYLFAYHPILEDTADHRDPAQWTFYVVPTPDLPVAKTISLARIAQLSDSLRIDAVAPALETARQANRPGQ